MKLSVLPQKGNYYVFVHCLEDVVGRSEKILTFPEFAQNMIDEVKAGNSDFVNEFFVTRSAWVNHCDATATIYVEGRPDLFEDKRGKRSIKDLSFLESLSVLAAQQSGRDIDEAAKSADYQMSDWYCSNEQLPQLMVGDGFRFPCACLEAEMGNHAFFNHEKCKAVIRKKNLIDEAKIVLALCGNDKKLAAEFTQLISPDVTGLQRGCIAEGRNNNSSINFFSGGTSILQGSDGRNITCLIGFMQGRVFACFADEDFRFLIKE